MYVLVWCKNRRWNYSRVYGAMGNTEDCNDFNHKFIILLLKDGIITFDEFVEYYQDVSSSIDNDAYFEQMMINA